MNDPLTLHVALSLVRPDFKLEVNLKLPANGITVLFGPSGSGKTTVLRCVAGLEQANGIVALDDDLWQDSQRKIFKPTWQREIGYVFQEASLFEHMDVRRNLNFGLRRIQRSGSTRTLDVAVELLGIGHLLGRSVESLSGGERQRVAIARSLATQPKLLLLDEPLASLDIARRREVLPWLERLHAELRIPVLYVTHSVDELARLADHVVMLEKGAVIASGSVIESMASHDVATAIGDEAGIVASGEIVARDDADHMTQIRFGAGTVWGRDQGLSIGQSVRLRILARDVSLSLALHEDTTIQNRFQGVIESIESDTHPSQALVRVRCGATVMLSRVTRRALQQLELQVGSAVWCQVKSVALIV
ncbi:MAG: molybdenum ABC transporter ATP-binding protein [Burkholderiales bacterium]|nr:molybdenum ABC transporter ATP-binding protein [Burkholderiales bacterium]